MAKKNVEYTISLEDKFSRNIKKLDNQTVAFESRLMKLGGNITKVFAGTAVIAAVGKLGKSIFDLGADLEQAEIAFETMLQSAELGKEVLADLQDFANVTPFTNKQVIQSARSLLAYNVEAEKLLPTLRSLGDISAGVGLQKMPNLILAFGQVKAATRLTGMELRQFTEAGVPLLDELSKVMQKPVRVIKDELIPAGDVAFPYVEQALKNLTGEGGRFFNLMAKQAKTQTGLWSTFVGKLQLASMHMGKRMLPTTKKVTKGLIGMADKLIAISKIPLSEELEDQRREIEGLIISLNNVNTSESDRLKIIKRINEVSPELAEGIKKEGDRYKVSTTELRKFNQQAINRIVIQKKQEEIDVFREKAAKAGEKAQRQLALIQEKRAQAFFKISKRNQKDADLVQEILMGNINTETELGELRQKYGEETAWLLNQSGLQTSRNQKEFVNAQNIAIKAIAERNGLSREQIGLGDDYYRLISRFNPLMNQQMRAQFNANKLQKEANKLATALGVTLDENAKKEAAGGVFTAVPGQELQDGITTIKAAAPKTFNVNINKLVELLNVNTTNLTEGAGEIEDKIVNVLSLALADIQTIAR